MNSFSTINSNWTITEKDTYWIFKCPNCGKERHFSKLLPFSEIESTEKDCPFCGQNLVK